MKKTLLLLSLVFLFVFTYFSYVVAKERLTQFDFDITVKLQDHVSRKYDQIFSYFSYLGSAEVTIAICLTLILLALARRKMLEIVGWMIIVPASLAEIFGKMVLFHPGPPVFMHRTLLPTSLPSFYVHTDYSYPSGHMTRTMFIATIFIIIIILSKKTLVAKGFILVPLLFFVFVMGVSRVYLGEHWLSDVLGGAFLGIGTGLFSSVLILRRAQDQP